ncbi:MAG: DnaD domain protein [Lachnospiraceae bacterium]|nr:DnaD domain protein [Lachnospiraceae bacterium]
MKELTLNLQSPKSTVIPNYFLDTYMPKANGEFVKVYLYLLRFASEPAAGISISMLADKLDNTEKDVMRALKYWEKEQLISLTYNSDNTLIGINMSASAPVDTALKSSDNALFPVGTNTAASFSIAAATTAVPTAIPASASASAVHTAAIPATASAASLLTGTQPQVKIPDKVTYSADEINTLNESEDFKTLLFIAQSYIGKTLSASDTDTLIYIFHTLKFPMDLAEYLIEYCVCLGHKSLHYIEKVALSWAEQGIRTVDEAKAISSFYKKECFQVLKAFGISKRNPVDSEIAMISKWSKEYSFSIDIILEACNRTMQAIHQPSFEYADSILTKWFNSGVKHLNDITILDAQYSNTRKRAAETNKAVQQPTVKPVVNKFNNMPSRSYIYEDLERQLLSQ